MEAEIDSSYNRNEDSRNDYSENLQAGGLPKQALVVIVRHGNTQNDQNIESDFVSSSDPLDEDLIDHDILKNDNLRSESGACFMTSKNQCIKGLKGALKIACLKATCKSKFKTKFKTHGKNQCKTVYRYTIPESGKRAYRQISQNTILRDRYERACQKSKSAMCKKACLNALRLTCDSIECNKVQKKAVKKSCPKECRHAFHLKRSTDDSDSDSS